MGSKFCSSAVVSEMGRISLGLLLSWVALAWRVTESRRIVRYCKKDGRTCSRPVDLVYNRHLLPKLPCCCHSSAEHGCCDFSKVKQEGLFAFESQQPVEPAEVIAARLFPESLRFWARQGDASVDPGSCGSEYSPCHHHSCIMGIEWRGSIRPPRHNRVTWQSLLQSSQAVRSTWT